MCQRLIDAPGKSLFVSGLKPPCCSQGLTVKGGRGAGLSPSVKDREREGQEAQLGHLTASQLQGHLP